MPIIDQMDAALFRVTTARNQILMCQIRDHMRSIGSQKAKGFAIKAAMYGNLPAIHTILNSPEYLMGLTKKT